MSSNYLQNLNFSTSTPATQVTPRTISSDSQNHASTSQASAKPVIRVDRLLTTRQAAMILGHSYETVKKWRSRDKGPAYVKLPTGSVRYRLSVLLKFLNDNTIQP